MKKLLLILFVMVVASGLSLGAQDLTDNPDYRKSVELNAKAAQSFSDGDYDAATDYANQAKQYAALSDQYIAKMVAKAATDKEMGKAKTEMAWADSNGSKVFYPLLYKVAADLYASAQASYAGGDYPTAGDLARNTMTAVQAIAKADADEAIADAKAGLSDAEAIAAPANYPKEYSEAKGELSDAIAAYDNQDFVTAAQKARACVAALAMVKAKTPSWPAVYVVDSSLAIAIAYGASPDIPSSTTTPSNGGSSTRQTRKPFAIQEIPTSSSRDRSFRSRA